jgi:hypothetical protein
VAPCRHGARPCHAGRFVGRQRFIDAHEPHARGPEEFAAFVKADHQEWSALIKQRGIELD